MSGLTNHDGIEIDTWVHRLTIESDRAHVYGPRGWWMGRVGGQGDRRDRSRTRTLGEGCEGAGGGRMNAIPIPDLTELPAALSSVTWSAFAGALMWSRLSDGRWWWIEPATGRPVIEIRHANYFDGVARVEYSTSTDIDEWEFRDVEDGAIEDTMIEASRRAELYVESVATETGG